MKIRLYLDDASEPFRELDNAAPLDFDTTGLPDGQHTLRVETVDGDSVTGIREVPFTVRNGPGIAVAGIEPGDELRGTVKMLVNASDAGIDARYEVHSMETHRGIPLWVGWFALGVILSCGAYIATDPFRQRSYDAQAAAVSEMLGRDPIAPTTGAAPAATGAAPAKAADAPANPMALHLKDGDFLPLLSNNALEADLKRGAELYAARCAGCHGPEGQGTQQSKVTLAEQGVYPRLAGQNRAYIVRQLASFADGWRTSAQMKPMAVSLADQDRLDIAAHIEGLSPPYPPREAVTEAMLERGKDIAEVGIAAKGVSRCSGCHGDNGRGGGANFPWLAGQSRDYLEAQLGAWQQGHRRNSWRGLMRPVADGLSKTDLQAVAAYYANIR